MSTQNIAFTFSFAAGNSDGAAISGIDKGGFATSQNVSAMGKRVALRTTSTSDQTATLNSTAKGNLYPNADAHPTEADFNMQVFGGWSVSGNRISGSVRLGNTTIYSYEHQSNMFGPYELPKASTGNKSQAVTSSHMGTVIALVGRSTKGAGAGYVSGSITLYFTRYDFSATADTSTGVTSASVANTVVRSNKNTATQGFTGDTMCYTCTLAAGAVFDGWYDGSTRVSSSQTYDYTVNGADKTLTARATMPTTKTVTVSMANHTPPTLFTKTIAFGDSVTMTYDNTTQTLITGKGTKRLSCAGAPAKTDIVIAGRTLKCKNLKFRGDIIVTVS